MSKLKLPVRIEELLPVARWQRGLLIQFRQQFTDYSPEFGQAFSDALDTHISAVENLISTKLFLGDLLQVTQLLETNMLALRPLLDLTEGYVKMASTNLKDPARLFNFKEIRKCINGQDAEKLEKSLGEFIQLVDHNKEILMEKGLKQAMIDDLTAKNETIADLADDQNKKIQAMEEAVNANSVVLMALWADCAAIMDAGKRIFKYTQPEQLPNFTLTYIIKKMRSEGGKDGNKPETPT